MPKDDVVYLEPGHFIDQDESCDWYIIPLDKKEEWRKYCEGDEAFMEEHGWNPPDYFQYIAHPSEVRARG